MRADLLAVYVNRRLVINSAEMENSFKVGILLGNGELPLIPYGIHKILVLDARKHAFRAERNIDCSLELCLRLIIFLSNAAL